MTVIKPQHCAPRFPAMSPSYLLGVGGYGAGMALSSMGSVTAGLLVVCAAVVAAALLFARSCAGRPR
jgi:hypothetical protein